MNDHPNRVGATPPIEARQAPLNAHFDGGHCPRPVRITFSPSGLLCKCWATAFPGQWGSGQRA